MKKYELMRFLEPFHDDIEIIVRGASQIVVSPVDVQYKPMSEHVDEACVIIHIGGWTMSPVISSKSNYTT